MDLEIEPLVCGYNHIQCFRNFGLFINAKYYSTLAEIKVDGEFAERFHWAYKIQLAPKENKFDRVHYIVAGRNAKGVGAYILDYKKVA